MFMKVGHKLIEAVLSGHVDFAEEEVILDFWKLQVAIDEIDDILVKMKVQCGRVQNFFTPSNIILQ